MYITILPSVFTVLDPQGSVALAERTLIIHAVLLMLIVALPVLILAFFFAWRYRVRGANQIPNKNDALVAYTPNWEYSKMEEFIWWAIPFEIVLILSALTWSSTHQLDPRNPLDGGTPLVIEVVALNWKWLFIYPEHDIAVVNYIEVPVGRPIRFDVTADAPMNSFWVPSLGGQIYAMTGMVNSINLIATKTGFSSGISSNYSGDGFAQMKFSVHAVSKNDFDVWVRTVKDSTDILNLDTYKTLAMPSIADNAAYYGVVEKDLYNSIVMKFRDIGNPTSIMQHY